MELFINENFVFQNTGVFISCSEAYAMLYEVLNEKEHKTHIIDMLDNLSTKSLSLYNIPCPYEIKKNGDSIDIYNNRNTQHYLWCVKAFYNHFKLTNDKKYYNKAEQIINYVCDNHCYNGSKIFINWFNCDIDNRVSIKALTCADMLLVFGKQDYLNANINFYKENMFNNETDLFYSYYNLNNKNYVNETATYLHENLELAEGLFNCYELNKNKEFYNIAVNIVKSCSKLVSSNVNNLARLQCYYWMKKYNITENLDLVKSEVQKIINIYKNDDYISPYSNKKFNNIFGHIYLQRIYKLKKIVIFGDSHSRIFKKIEIPNVILDVNSISGGTITGLAKRISTLQIRKNIIDYLKNNEPDYLILKFGQVDIELSYYYKQVVKNNNFTKEEYIDTIISTYKLFLEEIMKYIDKSKIIIFGINPPALLSKEKCLLYTSRIIFDNSKEKISELSNKLEDIEERTKFSFNFNYNLHLLCEQMNIKYTEVFTELLNNKNITNNLYTNDNDHHLKGIENDSSNFEPLNNLFVNQIRKLLI